MISVVILTKNKSVDLPECLKSVAWCDSIGNAAIKVKVS